MFSTKQTLLKYKELFNFSKAFYNRVEKSASSENGPFSKGHRSLNKYVDHTMQ